MARGTFCGCYFRVADYASGERGPGFQLYAKRSSPSRQPLIQNVQGLRANVSVQVKNVRGIVLSFERDEPLIVPAIRSSHGLLAVAT